MAKIALIDHSKQIKTLKDIKVPERFFNRMKMDVQVLDELFGGQDFPGILPGSSILFTGMPGAGKSTAALQFADLLQKNAGRNILYNVGEESDIMVTIRANRIGINGDFGISQIDDVDDLIQACKDTGVEVLFQDSLQSLTTKEDTSTRESWKIIAKKLHKFAKDENISVWIIGHITKGGDFAGPMEIKHDLDIHAHIKLNPETMAREFSLTKNRWGPSGIPYECNLGAKGLDFQQMALVPEEKDGEGKKTGGKAGERREAVSKIVKDAFLRGDKISGWSYTEFKDPFTDKMGIDCSGGFFRGIVERVKKQLQAEGHIFGERRIDGRSHIFIEI
jgi:KaiC/GvpD/RAD55 family RecA-like ATPase